MESAIRARDCPAIVVLQGERRLALSDYDYLRDQRTAAAFERRSADHAHRIHANRWVFAVPQVWLHTSDGIASRAVSNHPLREGEQEAITWTAFDLNDGVDYGLVPYTRRPDGEPVFGDPEVFTSEVTPGERAPGWTLLRALAEDRDVPPLGG
ncbi:hypothetical protein FH609_002570 [Streptomyces sp. 3MP-14]|uniref:Uncharacterized protein n=2 Tax=Streptomyces TaxID=1883 RepID=A0A5N6ACL3_9ACTN|nr:hypothetical protein FH607_011520 [Streptomyces mimosae]KAB8179246.1 hypothetical protein FH609_002570 [Streptomyces sp. 3MP-14]